MYFTAKSGYLRVLIGTCVGLAFVSPDVLAHCDTMNGPVVMDAKKALEKGDITPVLKWVQRDAEPEIKAAFEKAVAVRSKGAEEQAVADAYLFETLVRVHRAGEGAPYEGIKPEGTPIEPGIAAAEEALASGSADALVKEMTDLMADGIEDRFKHVKEAATHKDNSVEAGRVYVEAYVTFMHYVERLHQDASGPLHHGAESHESPDEKEQHHEQGGTAPAAGHHHGH